MKRLTEPERIALYNALSNQLVNTSDRIEFLEKRGRCIEADNEREMHATLLRVLAKHGWRTKPYEL